MRRTKKITPSQLRQIVMSEVRRLRESTDPDQLEQMLDLFREMYPYDENDPSMEAAGPVAWDQQLEDAVTDLAEAIEEIGNKLIQGEYYKGH